MKGSTLRFTTLATINDSHDPTFNSLGISLNKVGTNRTGDNKIVYLLSLLFGWKVTTWCWSWEGGKIFFQILRLALSFGFWPTPPHGSMHCFVTHVLLHGTDHFLSELGFISWWRPVLCPWALSIQDNFYAVIVPEWLISVPYFFLSFSILGIPSACRNITESFLLLVAIFYGLAFYDLIFFPFGTDRTVSFFGHSAATFLW